MMNVLVSETPINNVEIVMLPRRHLGATLVLPWRYRGAILELPWCIFGATLALTETTEELFLKLLMGSQKREWWSLKLH